MCMHRRPFWLTLKSVSKSDIQRFSGRLKLNLKLLVEVQSTMTSNYIDAAVYLCYIDSCHG